MMAYQSPPPATRPHRAATAVNRALAVLAVGGFLLIVRHVLANDPGPGLSGRGWLTLGVAVVVLILLRAHHTVALLVVLLVVLLVAPAPAAAPVKAAARTDRPVLVGIVAGVGDAIAELKRQANQGTAPPPTTTRRPR